MDTQGKDARSLAEIKAILERLQRIADDKETGSAEAASDPPAVRERTDDASEHSAKYPALPQSSGSLTVTGATQAGDATNAGAPRRRWLGAALTTCGIAAIVMAMIYAQNETPSASLTEGAARDRAGPDVATTIPDATPTPQTPPQSADSGPPLPPSEATERARILLSEGRVTAARGVLRDAAGKKSADAAFLLARSYDPSLLDTLPAPDAGPDAEAAKQWYRRWRELAEAEGMTMTDDRFERLLRPLR